MISKDVNKIFSRNTLNILWIYFSLKFNHTRERWFMRMYCTRDADHQLAIRDVHFVLFQYRP